MYGLKVRWLVALGALALIVPSAIMAASSRENAAKSSRQSAAKFTIGIVLNNAADPNQVNVAKGWKTQGAKYGWKSFLQVDTTGSADKANAAMEAFVQRKVNAIVVQVYESSALGAGLAAARKAKIPVFLNGSNSLAPGVAATEPVYAGVPHTTRMAKDLGGTGDVLMFTYHPGAPCVAEETLADKVLKGYPGISVKKQEVPAPGWVEAGQTATIAWLTSHPANSGALAIWGCWDGPLIGSIAALRAAGRTDVKLYGNGGQADALAAILKGDMTATWFYGDRTGDGVIGAKLLKQYLATKAAKKKWKPRIVPVPSIAVDKSNVQAICAKYKGYCG